jgi:hypothetical protein
MPDDDLNARGELSFPGQVRLVHGPVAGTWRDSQPGEDEFWYDVPPGPPVLPDVDDSDWGGARARASRRTPPTP